MDESGPVRRETAPEVDSRLDDAYMVADALEENLDWFPERQRPNLFAHIVRGEYEVVLGMLRSARGKHPRVASIPRAIEVVERALSSKLLFEIGRSSDEVVVQIELSSAPDDSPRATILRLARKSATLGELMDRCALALDSRGNPCELPRLMAIRILRDLADDGSVVVRPPARRTAGLRLGAQAAALPRPRKG